LGEISGPDTVQVFHARPARRRRHLAEEPDAGEAPGRAGKENAVAQLIFRARESLRTELRLLQVDPERLPEKCRRFLPLLAAISTASSRARAGTVVVYTAVVDREQAVIESDETNNTATLRNTCS
jgi:hypothetical protein